MFPLARRIMESARSLVLLPVASTLYGKAAGRIWNLSASNADSAFAWIKGDDQASALKGRSEWDSCEGCVYSASYDEIKALLKRCGKSDPAPAAELKVTTDRGAHDGRASSQPP